MSKTSNKRLMGQRSGQIKVNTASVQKSADKIKTLSVIPERVNFNYYYPTSFLPHLYILQHLVE